ncbi:PREDICTED: NXPE family member 3-like [Branchiostoma belcheri]|uniref:NXPE family member 3-like n=1 Tax=Branchiostoma belcheri TaxID=7741 RepID=A0A6P4Z602_BRABE|nr:PREDICTED: NXPE family member 3-like [Branchiostoma belcheri]
MIGESHTPRTLRRTAPYEKEEKLFSPAVYVKQFEFTLGSESIGQYSVGDLVHLVFSAKDKRNNTISNTGDFFRGSIISAESKSGAVGIVTDHQNGTYTATFRLLWEGEVTIRIQLVLPRQTIDVIEKNRREDPFEIKEEMVTFQKRFAVGKRNVDTQCNVDPVIFKDSPVCDYSDLHAGVRWYCVKPDNISCNTSGYLSRLRYKKTKSFGRWLSSVPYSVFQTGRDPLANRSRCVRGLGTPQISGFFQDGVWNSLVCKNRHFSDKTAWQQCLSGKTLHFIGDSTIRQWWEHLVRILEMNETRFPGVIHNTGPLLARDYLNNITVKFQIHGPPLRFGWTQEFHIKYLANAVDEVSGGPGDVVGITIWAHFTSFPVNVYRERIKAVRAAIERLLQRSPETLVVIKSANTNTGNMLYEGDWLAHRLDMVMRETFRGLNVVLVDAWEMTSAQNWHTDNLHPAEDIIVQELEFLCSFICPWPPS